jgi:outer membrane protein OmpA-like peptidoglycan-associated protein
MKESFDIVSGDFEGNFFTHQKSVLSASDWNNDFKDHEIHLYRGELKNISKESVYEPEKFRNRESFLLHNVTNVQFHLQPNSDGSNSNRIFNFEQLLLRDAVVKESWELNGKTYGIITGKLLGKVKEEVSGSNSLKPKPTPINPDPPPRWPFDCSKSGNGCMSFFSGCFTNIWRMLLGLLLLLFLLWCLKGCWGKHETTQNCCVERDSLQKELEKLKIDIDKSKNENELLRDSINKKAIQDTLDEISSRVYFYGGSTRIRKISENQIDKMVQIIEENPNMEIEIRGYHNGNLAKKYENDKTIDILRAEAIRDLLIEKGIDGNSITAVGMGESLVDDSNNIQKVVIDGDEFFWNRNMRVEIKVIKF